MSPALNHPVWPQTSTTGHLLTSYGNNHFIHASVWPLAASVALSHPLRPGLCLLHGALSMPEQLAGPTRLSGLTTRVEEMLPFWSLCSRRAGCDTGSMQLLFVESSFSCSSLEGARGTVLELVLVVKVGKRRLRGRGRADNGNKHWRSWSVQLRSLPAFHFLNEKRVPSGAS